MSIVWKYLDKKSAVVKALEDYSSMQFIIEHTDEKIHQEEERMTSVGSPRFDGMPRTHNPNAHEERLLDGLEKIDVLKERYRQAVEYMEWLKPAWKQLSEEEQDVLATFFIDDMYGDGAADAIARTYHIERASAYRKKNRALDHLTLLLYGKE